MKNIWNVFSLLLLAVLVSCNLNKPNTDSIELPKVKLTQEQALNLAHLPLKCISQEFPNKLSQTLANKSELGTPTELHPAFFGCFDWHSSVHGHWMLVKLLKLYPDVEIKDEIIKAISTNITKENILQEIEYFKRPTEKSYERTYGWAWLLKLAEELHTWDHPAAKELAQNLQPLADLIVERYIDFLPRLKYPIRVGEHTNTAFGLTFAYDYAITLKNEGLKFIIEEKAKDFYMADQDCPLNWEPSGYDFLSPCLEEADLMRRVLSKEEFKVWFKKFLPRMTKADFNLETAVVSDRSDGKLVHLDGLNFSRAWCLFGIANDFEEYAYLRDIAYEHIHSSIENVVGDSYEGSHWLASFALYALDSME